MHLSTLLPVNTTLSSPQHGLPRSLPATNCLVMGTRAYMTSSGTIHVVGLQVDRNPAFHLRTVAADRHPGAGGGRLRCRSRRRDRRQGQPCSSRGYRDRRQLHDPEFWGVQPLTSNISFLGNNPTSWLVIFDNVVHTGQMSCDKSQGNFIWFTNGSPTGLKPNCQNLFVPTEKINNQNPAGRTTAIIGVLSPTRCRSRSCSPR